MSGESGPEELLSVRAAGVKAGEQSSPLLAYGLAAMVLATVVMAPGAELLLGADGRFRPMGESVRWDRWVVGLHLVSDLLIGLAYVSISATLIYLARKAKQDIPFLWTFVAFGTFIIACGFTHLTAALTLWMPVYWAAAAIKIATAGASLATAAAIPPLVPRVLSLIEAAKASERRKEDLRHLTATLEARVAARTAELETAKREAETLLHHSPDIVARFDRELRHTYVNPAVQQATGLPPSAFVGKTNTDLGMPDAQVHQWERALRGVLETGEEVRIEFDFPASDAERSYEARLVPEYAPDGRVESVLSIARDTTPRKEAERALGESQERFRAIFEGAAIGIAVTDLEGPAQDTNPALHAMLGYSREEFRHLHWTEFTHPDDIPTEMHLDQELLSGMRDHYNLQKRYIHKDGRAVWVNLTVSLVPGADGRSRLAISTVEDITVQKEGERTLQHRALYDTLTNLPNRDLFRDRVQSCIAGPGSPSFAILLLDLDRFKEINDTFGHHYGDLVLREIGPRLEPWLRHADTISRQGGDEFAILLPEVDEARALAVAGRLCAALGAPFDVEGHGLKVEASIGIALYPQHGADANTLLRRADVAMYGAKRGGDGMAVYRVEDDPNTPRRLALITDLRQALEHGGLFLHYQPIANLTTGSVDHVEALVRWQHPEYGPISPAEFIPLAEHTGLIRPLTWWVLGEALRQCRSWHDAGMDVRVAVNLSARNLHDAHLVDTVADLMRQWAVPPACLELEITESALMVDSAGAAAALERLRAMGVTLAIDDFGTGYSSLGYLKRLPAGTVKIDRCFVRDLLADAEDAAIVRATIQLGHNLGRRIVAEGVEDGETWALLETMGCDLAQGYHLSRPLPAPQIEQWITSRLPGRAAG